MQKKNRRIYIIQYISVFLILIYSSASNAYFKSSYAELHLFFIILFLGLFIKGSWKIDDTLIFVLIIWLIYNLLYLLVYEVFSFNAFFYTPVLLIISQIIFNINRKKLLIRIADTIYIFAFISLIFYSLQVINFSSTANLLSSIQHFLGIEGLGHKHSYANIIIYTISDFESGIPGLRRNFGFMWEPGGFAAVLTTGLFINLYLNNFKIFRIKILIIIIAILTTFSTTGYLGLLIILGYYIYHNKQMNLSYILRIAAIVLIGIFLIKSQFIKEKIEYTYEAGMEYTDVTRESNFKGSLGRFGGLSINLKEFAERPVLGHYFDDSQRISRDHLNTSTNGLGNFLARHGLIIFIIFLIGYYKTSKVFFKEKTISMIFLGILIINAFAFNLIRTPYFVMFFIIGFLTHSSLYYFEKDSNENMYYN